MPAVVTGGVGPVERLQKVSVDRMRKILLYGDKMLETKAEPVSVFDEALASLASEMFDIMHDGDGVGLAAPQVGVPQRIFIVHIDGDKRRLFVNPEIIETSQEVVEYEEGCLSFPGLYFTVKRPAAVKIQAFNEKGKPFTLDADGFLARVVQHEYDHLDGKLFIDRITSLKRERALLRYHRLVRM